MAEKSYKIVPPDGPRSPLIVHVPHASTFIPEDARKHFVVDDETLQREIIRLTDWHVDVLFGWAPQLGGSMFVSEVSRLVFDPERFADDEQEPAARFGQGVVYTHMSDGRQLAEISAEERARRIRSLYEPYHKAMTGLVRDKLAEFGRCLILDCHSYPRVPLPTETGDSSVRPDICVGTDEFHTPVQLIEALVEAMRVEGFSVEVNAPFEGTLVPTEFWQKDSRVQSVMIEVRRDLYCDEETGELLDSFLSVRAKVRRSVERMLP